MAEDHKDTWQGEKGGRHWAARVIRAHMVKRGISYADLVERLSLLGIEENERNLRNKVARGTFSAVFFAQCLTVIGVSCLDLDMADQVLSTNEAFALKLTIERLNEGMEFEEARIDPSSNDLWPTDHFQIKDLRPRKSGEIE